MHGECISFLSDGNSSFELSSSGVRWYVHRKGWSILLRCDVSTGEAAVSLQDDAHYCLVVSSATSYCWYVQKVILSRGVLGSMSCLDTRGRGTKVLRFSTTRLELRDEYSKS